VLSDEEQALLTKHQEAFHKSHTYYRPHETFTHHAFPIKVLTAIIVLCDFHSIFQLSLGSTTWSISYHHNYKKIITTIILCFSLSCNISGGILIAVGNRLTRKTEVVETLMKQAITEEAIQRKQDVEKYRAEKRLEQDRERDKMARRHIEDDDLGRASSFPPAIENLFKPNHHHQNSRSLGRHDTDPGSHPSIRRC